MIQAKIIADSKNIFGDRLTTMVVTFPRIILSEFNTHRTFCLAGDTILNFDLPTSAKNSKHRKYSMTIKEFVEKWHFGVKPHKVGSIKNFNLDNIIPQHKYTAKQLAALIGMKTPTNIRTWCRSGRLKYLNMSKLRQEDYLIRGSDFIKMMEGRGVRTFNIDDRLGEMKIRQLDEKDGTIKTSTISNCTISGKKQLFKLILENGNTLRCSAEHKILTESGWKMLKELTLGDFVIVQKFGTLEKKDVNKYKKINGKWVSQWIRKIKDSIFKQQRNVCTHCSNKPTDIHHIIPIHKDITKAFDKRNIVGLCTNCHRNQHKKQTWQISQYLYGEGVKVKSITKDAIEQTYDLEISGQFKNFVANNIIVHNSRNSASSRAIPFEKMVKSVQENPFIPIAYQQSHKGMQGTKYYTSEQASVLTKKWLKSRDRAIEDALDLAAGLFTAEEIFEFDENGNLITLQNEIGVTKQLCNRLLEPFMYHTVLVTASEFENFFALRCPQYALDVRGGHINHYRSKKDWLKRYNDQVGKTLDIQNINIVPNTDLEWLHINKGQAEIHMMALAEAMWEAYNESVPKELHPGEWHIPFGDNIDTTGLYVSNQECEIGDELERRIQIATARCARISYTVFGEEGKNPNYKKDIELHDKLLESKHYSPFEHCAQSMTRDNYDQYIKGKTNLHIMKNDGHGNLQCEVNLDETNSNGWCNNFKGFIQYRHLVNK